MGRPQPGTFHYMITSGKQTIPYTLTILDLGRDRFEYRMDRAGPAPESYLTFVAAAEGLDQVDGGYRGSITGGCTYQPPVLQYPWKLHQGQRWSTTSECPQKSSQSRPRRYDFAVVSVDSHDPGGPCVTIEEHAVGLETSSDDETSTFRFDLAHGLLLDQVTDYAGLHTHRWLVSPRP